MLIRRSMMVALTLWSAGCMTDPQATLPKDTNEVRMRSVVIDAATRRHKDGSFKACATIATKDMRRVAEMRGVIGAPIKALELDDDANAKAKTYGNLSAFWSRIPMGYGCDHSIQGIFPDGTKDPNIIANYNFNKLDDLVGAVRNARRVPLWTAGFGLGDGKGTCAYGNVGMTEAGKPVAEQLGAVIGNADADITRWAQVVRRITKRYNRDLPAEKKSEIVCNPPAGQEKDWRCSASLFDIEFGRDPNGAGGFTTATKSTWLKTYKAFAKEMREEFPYPANSVLLYGPSVVIRSSAEASNTDASDPKRSWLYDFIDYVVAQKLALSVLSFEVEAATPVEARDIAKHVRAYADKKGLKDESGNPIRLFVTDLRLNDSKVPESLAKDATRFSAYLGAFYSATKILWQGYVDGATVGRVMRFPTKNPSEFSPTELAQTALDSDLLWFDQPKPVSPGDLKPGAWHAFWFNSDFLGSGGGTLDGCADPKGCPDIAANARHKGMVVVEHGPDAVGLSGEVESNEVRGLIAIATRENCVSSAVDQLGQPIDCVAAGEFPFPAVTEGRKRVIRAMVADLHVTVPSAKEVLMHNLRVEVKGIPTDAKTVGYRWARMDGTAASWGGFVFPEQGVLDVHDGVFHVQRTVAVPSMHYFEFLY